MMDCLNTTITVEPLFYRLVFFMRLALLVMSTVFKRTNRSCLEFDALVET